MLALKEGVCSEEEGTVEEQWWETPGLWWKIKVRTTQGQEEATVEKKQTRKSPEIYNPAYWRLLRAGWQEIAPPPRPAPDCEPDKVSRSKLDKNKT